MEAAKQSPRIEGDGSIRWYAGDTFVITLNFIMKDEEGEIIEPLPTDIIEVQFVNHKNDVLATFTSEGSSSINLNIDKQKTKSFKEGVYYIRARFNSVQVTTLLHNNRVVVE